MRIGIIGDPIDRQQAGVHTFTLELIRAVLALKSQHEFILIRSKSEPSFEGTTEVVCPVLNFPGMPSLRLFYQIPQIFKKYEVDVVVEPGHFGPFNLPAKIKRVTVIHDLTPILMPSFHTFFGQFLQRIFLPGILRRTDLIISNSHYTQSDIEKYFPYTKGKVATTPLGKDSIFVPVNDFEVPAKYGIDQPYFLFVGTIEPRKNLITLLSAFEQYKSRTGESVKLVLVGQKGWKSEPFYEALCRSEYRDEIILPGYVAKADLPYLYSHAMAFVYPSLYEGFGLPVLEAMSCGTPCILSNTSSLPEVGGPDALYFQPKDVATLSDHMASVQEENVRLQMRAAHLKQAAVFNWTRTARLFLTALEGLQVK